MLTFQEWMRAQIITAWCEPASQPSPRPRRYVGVVADYKMLTSLITSWAATMALRSEPAFKGGMAFAYVPLRGLDAADWGVDDA